MVRIDLVLQTVIKCGKIGGSGQVTGSDGFEFKQVRV